MFYNLSPTFQLRHEASSFYGPSNSDDRVDTDLIGHVHYITTMQLFTEISRNTQSKLYTLSLTEGVWDFQNDAL